MKRPARCASSAKASVTGKSRVLEEVEAEETETADCGCMACSPDSRKSRRKPVDAPVSERWNIHRLGPGLRPHYQMHPKNGGKPFEISRAGGSHIS
ncbi:hypothetical protein BCAR13_1960002 [Paraburkholderia caribensis]|nr:hypothetical protein BCAR13_1960002 [Paraburkholderia caribensis]